MARSAAHFVARYLQRLMRLVAGSVWLGTVSCTLIAPLDDVQEGERTSSTAIADKTAVDSSHDSDAGNRDDRSQEPSAGPQDAGPRDESSPIDGGARDAGSPDVAAGDGADACDPLDPQSPRAPLAKCPAGSTCILDETNAEDGRVPTHCAPAGSLNRGESCAVDADCGAGMFCDEARKYCAKFCAEQTDCASGELCVSLEQLLTIAQTSLTLRGCLPLL